MCELLRHSIYSIVNSMNAKPTETVLKYKLATNQDSCC